MVQGKNWLLQVCFLMLLYMFVCTHPHHKSNKINNKNKSSHLHWMLKRCWPFQQCWLSVSISLHLTIKSCFLCVRDKFPCFQGWPWICYVEEGSNLKLLILLSALVSTDITGMLHHAWFMRIAFLIISISHFLHFFGGIMFVKHIIYFYNCF